MKELFQTKCPVLAGCLIVYALTLASGCKQPGYSSPDGYDLNKPVKMELGKVLNEISGLYFNEDDNTLLAVADSKEKVYQIGLQSKKLKDLTGKVVPPDSDIEDVVKIDSVVYLLSSSGTLKKVVPGQKDTAGTVSFSLGLQGKNDFETVYYDPTAKGLVLICKTCAHEKGQRMRTAYRFDLDSNRFDTSVFFTISRADVKELLKND
ncbi:MAG TPA: hypothetical protein VFZ78_04230, partial [Flavisolibacter sp.]